MPVVDLANAYPTYLQQFFNDRIPSQTFTVVNAGLGGERVADNDLRLKDALARHQPQVLLLLEGINDLNNGASAQTVVNALRDSIRTARDRGVQFVFVSTLLPVARDVCGVPPPRCRAADTPVDVQLATNDMIRSMVPANGAHLVDPYNTFVANRVAYIDVDGLHMRPEGYRALATAFWDRIVQVIPPALLFGT
jgi:lysophospholipase L1-like esterase